MRLVGVLLATVLLGAGCASSDFNPSGGEALPPYSGTVEVLDRLPTTGSYRMVGIVTVHGAGLTSDERMFEQLKARAAAQGADAVVPQGAIRERTNSSGNTERTLAAHAIRRR